MQTFRSMLILFVISIIAMGCSREDLDREYDHGNKTIQLYSGGKLIGTFESVGTIHSESHSDGYYFRDKATDRTILISGDVIIRPIP